ncbi:hydroxymyristoyl-ACP dehydratase [Clostridium rectalis]|uniref:hydroxymyristoyl-ACP dehydratase n=1 Tax=Clostridium rectalis TaxID=2040295 RepID=UPI000F63B122|nr:hydroxymyristoyl-ACP dehydratase [Clostridium rectalis]
MVNINCSENCIYSIDGVCTFETVSNFSNNINPEHNCAYFVDKEHQKNFPKL